MKKIVILGSTGSIGTQTLEIIKQYPREFKVIGLSAHNNENLLAKQIAEFKPKYAVSTKRGVNFDKEVEFLASIDEADLIVNAVSGFAGLMPAYAACRAGKSLVLANKESIVCAGELIMKTAKKYGAKILPVDSEMSAVWQSLESSQNPMEAKKSIEKVILTASGGPFWGEPRKVLEQITPKKALNHPTWKMGKKVTIDSATLINKGFEIIEARWLFDVPAGKIDVTVHRQSIVHSFVQFKDGNLSAILSNPSMKYPISYALFYPKRHENSLPRVDFSSLNMTFEKPNYSLLQGPKIAREVLEEGGIMPAAFCILDEIAVNKFLLDEISFLGIFDFIKRELGKIKNEKLTLPGVLELSHRINRNLI